MTRRETKHHALLTSVLRPPGTPHRTPTPHIRSLNEKLGIVFNGLLQNSLTQKLKWFFCPCCSVEHKSVIHRSKETQHAHLNVGLLEIPHGDLGERDRFLGNRRKHKTLLLFVISKLDQFQTKVFRLRIYKMTKKYLHFLETEEKKTVRPFNFVKF
jgi:hypothetical protein